MITLIPSTYGLPALIFDLIYSSSNTGCSKVSTNTAPSISHPARIQLKPSFASCTPLPRASSLWSSRSGGPRLHQFTTCTPTYIATFHFISASISPYPVTNPRIIFAATDRSARSIALRSTRSPMNWPRSVAREDGCANSKSIMCIVKGKRDGRVGTRTLGCISSSLWERERAEVEIRMACSSLSTYFPVQKSPCTIPAAPFTVSGSFISVSLFARALAASHAARSSTLMSRCPADDNICSTSEPCSQVSLCFRRAASSFFPTVPDRLCNDEGYETALWKLRSQ